MSQNYMGYSYYYPQQRPIEQNYQQYNAQFFRTIPVSDIAEANATTVDTNGQPTFFYNKGKGEIYLKQFDINTGGAIFKSFKLVVATLNESEAINDKDVYVERFNAIESKLDTLASMFEEKGKKKKVEE